MSRRRPPHLSGCAALAAPILLPVVAACGSDSGSAIQLTARAEDGRAIARDAGCSACHGLEGEGGIGPAWIGVYGSAIELDDGATVVADETYLTRAITDPAAEVHVGFDVAMPENELDGDDVAAVVDYIQELGS